MAEEATVDVLDMTVGYSALADIRILCLGEDQPLFFNLQIALQAKHRLLPPQ